MNTGYRTPMNRSDRMKNLLLTTLAIAGLSVPVTGQKVVVKSVSGKAMYAMDCKRFGRRLAVGDQLDPTGCVRLQRDARLMLVYAGKSLDLKQGVDNRLAELAASASHIPEDGFWSKLYQFISRSMADSETEEKLLAVSAGLKEKHAGIRGGLTYVPSLVLGWHVEGLVGSSRIHFHWESGRPTEELVLGVWRRADMLLLLERSVSGSTFATTPGELELEAGETYLWQVRSPTDPGRISEFMAFTYSPEGAEQVLAVLDQLEAYRTASPLDQLMAQALHLEEAGYRSDAAARWEVALSTYPKDRLVSHMIAAFHARMGLSTSATSLHR